MSLKTTISVEGNIGVGKSTFVKLFNKYLDSVEVIDEPIEKWKTYKDDDGNDIFKLFYSDKKRYAYVFQNIIYVTKMSAIENAIKTSDKKYIILDRSLDTDKHIFEKMLHDQNIITNLEHQIYQDWSSFYLTHVKTPVKNLIVYLKCNPNIALQRVAKRAREEESNMSFDYINSLNEYHDTWLLNNNTDNVLIVDCDKEFENDEEYQQEIFNKIKNSLNQLDNC